MIASQRRSTLLAALALALPLLAAGAGSAPGATRRPCFGAAARDTVHRCANPARTVTPAPDAPDPDPSAGCDPVAAQPDLVCTFGASRRRATAQVALIGDSHSYHWRAALGTVARAQRWQGYSLMVGGCFFSEGVKLMFPGAREPCAGWYGAALAWLRAHPQVSTLFVTQNADTPLVLAPGQTQLGLKTATFEQTYRALPRSVKHLVVLRDTPASSPATFDCLRRVIAAGDARPGQACALDRSVALRADPAVAAVRRLHAGRYASIDMTRYFCGVRKCYPVIGGALVNADVFGHITVTYAHTLGPYLLRAVRRMEATW